MSKNIENETVKKEPENENVKKEAEKVNEDRLKFTRVCRTTSILNVRSGPSKNHKIVGALPSNSPVMCNPDEYDKAINGWQNGYVKISAKIDDKKYDGYCSTYYLR